MFYAQPPVPMSFLSTFGHIGWWDRSFKNYEILTGTVQIHGWEGEGAQTSTCTEGRWSKARSEREAGDAIPFSSQWRRGISIFLLAVFGKQTLFSILTF